MKSQIRKNVLSQLKQLPRPLKEKIETDFFNQLIKLDCWKHAKMVSIVLSRAFEWETRRIINFAWNEGKRVCVPKVMSKKDMIFVRFDKQTPLVVTKGLEEPESHEAVTDIDLIIVPGVVFDNNGYRIGFGGGYYDRYLANFNGDTVSMVHKMQLIDDLPVESHDIPVQQLIISSIEE